MFAFLRRWLGRDSVPTKNQSVPATRRSPKKSTALRLDMAAIRVQMAQEDHAKAPRWR